MGKLLQFLILLVTLLVSRGRGGGWLCSLACLYVCYLFYFVILFVALRVDMFCARV